MFLLATLFNQTQQYITLPCIQIISIIVGVISSYTWMNLRDILPHSMLATFALAEVDVALTQGFIFGAASHVYTHTKKLLPLTWKREARRISFKKQGDRKSARKFIRSCAPIKIRCGSLNYIGSLTPLRFIDFSFVTSIKLTFMWRRLGIWNKPIFMKQNNNTAADDNVRHMTF